MKLALLGADAVTHAVAQALSDSDQHQLVATCELGAGWPTLPLVRIGPQVRSFENWESLLDRQLVDGVVVACSPDEDRRAEQLRKFMQADMPVMAAHPLFTSMLVYYELDMIRRDTGCVLLPYLPDRLHPAVVELARLAADEEASAVGQVEQVLFERQLTVRSKPNVAAHFARDVDTLRAIVGDVSRIGAVGSSAGPGSSESAYSSLSVNLTATQGWLARWSVLPAEASERGRLILVGSAGRAVVTMPGGAEPWSFELSAGERQMSRQMDASWNPAAAALEQFQLAVDGESVHPDWVDAARSLELTETIDRCLARGRTIELHYEDYSEESTFKGTMASLGCGVLMAGLVLLVVVAVLEDLGRAAGRQIPLAGRWPMLLLGLLGLFLLLQLLVLAFRRDKPGSGPPAAGSD